MCSQSGFDHLSLFSAYQVVLCLRKPLHSSGPSAALLWKVLPFSYNCLDLKVWGGKRRKCLKPGQSAYICDYLLQTPPFSEVFIPQTPPPPNWGWCWDVFLFHYGGENTHPLAIPGSVTAKCTSGLFLTMAPSLSLPLLAISYTFCHNHTPSSRISHSLSFSFSGISRVEP